MWNLGGHPGLWPPYCSGLKGMRSSKTSRHRQRYEVFNNIRTVSTNTQYLIVEANNVVKTTSPIGLKTTWMEGTVMSIF